MKKLIILSIACCFAFACSKESSPAVSGDYNRFNLFLTLINPDGNPYKEGEILHWYQVERDGEMKVEFDKWYVLEKIPNIRLGPDEYFITVPDFRTLDEYEFEIGTQWVNKLHHYVKYENSGVVDTLTIRDSLHYPEYRYFELFLNGEKYDYTTSPTSQSTSEWLATIKKEKD